MSNNVIIIPALNPDNRLIDLVKSLKEDFTNIIIVNDGSTKDKDIIFKQLKELNCIIETHKENQGKGTALKTGIKSALKIKDANGFITADADGQHTKKDIIKLSKELDKNSNSIILGTRNFNSKNVPLRSKIGNKFSSIYFYLYTSKKCQDTQTGLRAIPIKFAQLALETEGERFEYEMNFLLKIACSNIDIKNINITTIYENNNKSSHFRTIIDSYIIYKKMFLFILASIISALIDISLFYILETIGISIIISTIFARLISGIINFTLNKKITFKSIGNTLKEGIYYLLLFIIQMILSAILVNIISKINTNIIIIKVIIDTILFIISYKIQKKYIFNNKKVRIINE